MGMLGGVSCALPGEARQSRNSIAAALNCSAQVPLEDLSNLIGIKFPRF
jgi:hypothetical protein